MTETRHSDDIETSLTGVGGLGFGNRLRLSPVGMDVAVVVVVFGASVINIAAQDATAISGIPVAGFLLLAIGNVALFWRRSWPLAVLGVALATTVASGKTGLPTV